MPRPFVPRNTTVVTFVFGGFASIAQEGNILHMFRATSNVGAQLALPPSRVIFARGHYFMQEAAGITVAGLAATSVCSTELIDKTELLVGTKLCIPVMATPKNGPRIINIFDAIATHDGKAERDEMTTAVLDVAKAVAVGIDIDHVSTVVISNARFQMAAPREMWASTPYQLHEGDAVIFHVGGDMIEAATLVQT